MKKKILIGAALSVGYLILCRLMRGYWALEGDLIVIAMATAAYLILDKMPERDREGRNNEPTYIKVAKGTDGIEKGQLKGKGACLREQNMRR